MSLVENAIARLKEAAGTAPGAPRSSPPQIARVTTHAGGDPQRVVENSRVLSIDNAAMRANGYLPEISQDRQFAEHFRQIKRPLIERALAADGRSSEDPRVLMITSALPGEGKTFTSINLAFSLAREKDVSVLLVDADILKPHISEIFGVRQEPGLMDALGDESLSIESLVLATNVKGLSVLPAGRAGEGAAELLVSNRMRQILGALLAANPRRMVLLDSPPILVTSEARALTRVAGQLLLVVRAGQTPQTAVRSAIAQMDANRMGGIVLNDARLSLSESLYGYGAYGAPPDENSHAG